MRRSLSDIRSILRTQQFDRRRLERIFQDADRLSILARGANIRSLESLLAGRVAFLVFYEPSTRTRFSFSLASQRLGMKVVETESAGHFSSAVKGETLSDTIRVLCEYQPDVIVLRHGADNSAEEAEETARHYGVPIINAGAGKNQHPTQTLLDMYAIFKHFGRLDGLTVTIGGDLKHGRTARSLAYLLSKYEEMKILFVAPPRLQVEKDILSHLKEHGVQFELTNNAPYALGQSDVIYWTRTQLERMTPGQQNGMTMVITPELMKIAPAKSILLHPLPRVDEIAKEVDQDPRAVYFKQAGYGVPIRMALFLDIFETACP